MTLEVGLGLKLLHIEAVPPREHLPVDVPQIVPRRVGPVVGELDREPSLQTPVAAREHFVHDRPRSKLQAVNFSIVSAVRMEMVGSPWERRWTGRRHVPNRTQ